jgi:hypothetical protein
VKVKVKVKGHGCGPSPVWSAVTAAVDADDTVTAATVVVHVYGILTSPMNDEAFRFDDNDDAAG